MLCRGSKYLCGLTYCPVYVESRARLVMSKLNVSKELSGSSPPSAFVSRFNYPKVLAAITLPPELGDTSVYDLTESWIGIPLERVLSFRLSLVRSAVRVNVSKARGRYVELLQEVALSEKPVDTEVRFWKIRLSDVVLDEYAPPVGPLGLVERVRLGSNPSFGRHVNKVYYDDSLKASDAVLYLYNSGIPVSRISRILSVGGLGKRHSRKLVPTRWSITAVDKVISDTLVRQLSSYSTISEFKLFVREYMRNLFVGILIPGNWMFEWVEAWFPGSTWNLGGSEVEIEGDWELGSQRNEYPSIGGCYYASRLAVAEYLNKIRRKASVFLYREIYPGFNLPVGVWFVRENIRRLFSGSGLRFNSINELLDYLGRYVKVPVDVVVRKSKILTLLTKFKRLL